MFALAAAVKGMFENNTKLVKSWEYDEVIAGVTTAHLVEETYATKADLPLQGELLIRYCIQETLDMYLWDGRKYVSYNPYTDKPGVSMVDDPSMYIPSAGSIESRITYNIWALREDLRAMEKLNISMEQLIPKTAGRFVNLTTQKVEPVRLMTAWLKYNHTALYNDLKQSIKLGGVDRTVVDTVNNLQAFFGKDDKGDIIFRDGSLKVKFN